MHKSYDNNKSCVTLGRELQNKQCKGINSRLKKSDQSPKLFDSCLPPEPKSSGIITKMASLFIPSLGCPNDWWLNVCDAQIKSISTTWLSTLLANNFGASHLRSTRSEPDKHSISRNPMLRDNFSWMQAKGSPKGSNLPLDFLQAKYLDWVSDNYSNSREHRVKENVWQYLSLKHGIEMQHIQTWCVSLQGRPSMLVTCNNVVIL